MSKLKVICIVGARPNFMKVAPIMRALSRQPDMEGVVVHTGQHYNSNMSDVFFEQLGIPRPTVNLGVGSGSHAAQTARIMEAFDEAIPELDPGLVLVVGDVNSTIACALVSIKLGIPVGHVEAGLRSNDRTMPEEINRLLTDQISDCLFTTEPDARVNLLREGIDEDRIYFTGNTMIDTLVYALPAVDESDIGARLGCAAGSYGVVTFHRPSNVDDPAKLPPFLDLLADVTSDLPLVFPVHPRTRNRLTEAGLWERMSSISGLQVTEPLPYIEFMALARSSALVLTDSGGIQEETTYLGVPCITQRTSTERPITISEGTNVLVGEDFDKSRAAVRAVLSGKFKKGKVPDKWDGRCAERIVDVVRQRYG